MILGFDYDENNPSPFMIDNLMQFMQLDINIIIVMKGIQ